LCRPDGTRDEETAFKLALPTHGTNDFFSSLSLLNFFSALSLSLLLCQCIEIQKGSRIKKKAFFTIEMKKAARVKVLKKKKKKENDGLIGWKRKREKISYTIYKGGVYTTLVYRTLIKCQNHLFGFFRVPRIDIDTLELYRKERSKLFFFSKNQIVVALALISRVQ
jgi:hypothetical protein